MLSVKVSVWWKIIISHQTEILTELSSEVILYFGKLCTEFPSPMENLISTWSLFIRLIWVSEEVVNILLRAIVFSITVTTTRKTGEDKLLLYDCFEVIKINNKFTVNCKTHLLNDLFSCLPALIWSNFEPNLSKLCPRSLTHPY